MPQIECTIRRKGGTLITMGSNAYHFLPDSTGRHIASVNDQAHAKRLLEITPTYKLVPASRAQQAKPEPDAQTEPETPVPVTEPETGDTETPVAASTETAQVLQGDSGAEAATATDQTEVVAKPRARKSRG